MTKLVVPVIPGFDSRMPPVGMLHIEESALRPTPNFVFVLGYTQHANADYTLTALSISTDIEYGKYLEQRGIVASKSHFDMLRRALLKFAAADDDLNSLKAMREAVKRLPCSAEDMDAMVNALAVLIETHQDNR